MRGKSNLKLSATLFKKNLCHVIGWNSAYYSINIVIAGKYGHKLSDVSFDRCLVKILFFVPFGGIPLEAHWLNLLFADSRPRVSAHAFCPSSPRSHPLPDFPLVFPSFLLLAALSLILPAQLSKFPAAKNFQFCSQDLTPPNWTVLAVLENHQKEDFRKNFQLKKLWRINFGEEFLSDLNTDNYYFKR